jgi:predicted nucleic acid-binding protein
MGSGFRLQKGAFSEVNVFVDTSVWSLAFRRDAPSAPEVDQLQRCLAGGDTVVSTGLVLQELLQGFRGPKAADRIIQRFSLLPTLLPELDDHIEAARLRNHCRRKGVQVGTIDALIAQLCIRYDLLLLTRDDDFQHMARHTPLTLLAVR